MSDLINTRVANFRWKLLSSVSAFTLLGSVYASGAVEAAEKDVHSQVWLELGWQLEGISGSAVPFMPPFTDKFALIDAPSADIVQKVMPYSYGAEGEIAFRPEGTNWAFSAAVRYGRAGGKKETDLQTNAPPLTFHTTGRFGRYPITNPKILRLGAYKSGRASARNSETHVIVDFEAGRDVGLGAFGNSSVVGAGVRFAQLGAENVADIAALPDAHFARSFYNPQFHAVYFFAPAWHDYAAASQNKMSFTGIGPSLSWKASAPIAGNAQNGELTFDWGANAALLFGRQKTRGQHQATGRYFGNGHFENTAFYGPSPTSHDRSHRVLAPNLGGFAGMSLQWRDAKVSLGYRADFFFNALDTGIDTRQDTTRGYYGPFANISIGLGRSGN